MLTTAVGAVENRSLFLSVVHDLGRRHAAYGVTLSHFDLVRGAVLDSLAETLGPRFDAATRAAWAALLDDLRAVMLGGMATPA
jgi:hemoglobin-like flavoprotein